MSTLQDVEAWRGKKMVDADGDKIGTIEAVFGTRGIARWYCRGRT